MLGLMDSIRAYAETFGSPYSGPAISVEGSTLPPDYWAVVAMANGFVSRKNLFRLFAVRERDAATAGAENQPEWAVAYGELLQYFTVVAEDIFGDLYGYENTNTGLRLAKFFCEGGKIEQCIPDRLPKFLQEKVLVDQPSAFDSALAFEAIDAGLVCSTDEHLAFSLPLIAGGEYTVENLSVESRELHLGTLGQISVSNLDLPDETPIGRFVQE